MQRGVRQGDPLSAYLFIICMEILAINLRSNKRIRGIGVNNEEIKMGLFADDLTAFLRDDCSLVNFLKLVKEFGLLSGLKINFEKSEIMFLGNLVLFRDSLLPRPENGPGTQAGKERVLYYLQAHARNDAIFSPKTGGKTIFGKRFLIWA